MENQKSVNGVNAFTFRLVVSAVMIALAAVLSIFKIFEMPFGGEITLCSMLPIMVIGYRYGVKWGLFTGFAFSVIKILLDAGQIHGWGLTAPAVAGSFLLDYIVAFSVLGISGIYGKGFVKYLLGMITAVFFRFASHVLSGVIIWGTSVPKDFQGHALLYSIYYNGAFLLPDLIICLIAAVIIYKPLKNFLEG